MDTIRQTSGLAGFPKRDESIYDAFGAGHSSTSISAGLGKLFLTFIGNFVYAFAIAFFKLKPLYAFSTTAFSESLSC